MRRKLIVLLLVLAVPFSIFADALQLGVNVGYGIPYDEIKSGDADYFALRNFRFSPELRANIFFLQLDLVPEFSFSEGYVRDVTQATLALQAKLFDVVRLGAGAGISMPFESYDGHWSIGGEDIDGFSSVLSSSRMLYKLNLGILVNAFEITLNWLMPAQGSFDSGSFLPDIGNSTFSLGFLFSLI